MSKKQVTIGSKAVKPGPDEVKMRYDLGKYENSPIGKTVEVYSDVRAIWGFRGKDQDGSYWGLMCVTKR